MGGATRAPQFVIVSNRGPFSFAMRDGEVVARRGAGGLVTAISSVAREHDVLWVSCALGKGDAEWLARAGGVRTVEEMRIRLTVPDPAQYRGYHNVISNPLLWFVQHQLQDAPRFPMIDHATWQAWAQGYAGVNRQLAETVAESLAGATGRVVVLVQDYHLYLLPRYLRALMGDRVYIHFFSHIPSPERARALRHQADEVLESLDRQPFTMADKAAVQQAATRVFAALEPAIVGRA